MEELQKMSKEIHVQDRCGDAYEGFTLTTVVAKRVFEQITQRKKIRDLN